MAVLLIPTPLDLFAYRERVTLDLATFEFRFYFNSRADCWLVDIADEAGNSIVFARRLVVTNPLLRQSRHLAVPAGEIMAFDTTLQQRDPILDDLGSRVLMVYADESEIEALRNG